MRRGSTLRLVEIKAGQTLHCEYLMPMRHVEQRLGAPVARRMGSSGGVGGLMREAGESVGLGG